MSMKKYTGNTLISALTISQAKGLAGKTKQNKAKTSTAFDLYPL